MEKIYFDDTTFIWKTTFDISHIKENVINECVKIIEGFGEHPTDNYGLFTERKKYLDSNEKFEITTKIDEITNVGISSCVSLFNKNNGKPYDKINIDGWINVIRAKNPKQDNFKKSNEIEMHSHSEINKQMNSFIPSYTYVHYVQMPDNLENKDGVLYIEGKDGIVYDILPKENDMIIMNANIPHVPASAKNSTKDRIVIAGNVGFEYIKKNKTLM
jgi:hypothetical protein